MESPPRLETAELPGYGPCDLGICAEVANHLSATATKPQLIQRCPLTSFLCPDKSLPGQGLDIVGRQAKNGKAPDGTE